MSEKMIFTTPCIYKSEGFGCASFGFAGAPVPTGEVRREWKKELDGEMFSGSLENVLKKIEEKSKDKSWQAGIVLFGNCGGENEFMRRIQGITHCEFTGGAAAMDPISGNGGLIAGDGEVAVYLIDDENTQVHVESRNIHNHALGVHKIGFTDPRFADTIDGEDAVKWFEEKRREYGFDESDFEHMTFSDLNGVNAHFSINDGRLFSGRDLTENMILRYVDKGNVFPQMAEFYNDPDALVFGCAGLKGILERDIMEETMGMFMFGEVATMTGIADFGNLMLSKLVVE